MNIVMEIHHIEKLFDIMEISFTESENGKLRIIFKNLKNTDYALLNSLHYFDCDFIFSNLKEKVKLSLLECSIKYHDTFILTFDNEYTYPKIHEKLFEWIDFKLKPQSQNRFWLSLNQQEKWHWLRLNFEFQKSNPVLFNQQAIINGLFIKDKLDFLCEMGEQLVNYGYAGSDLDGLEDVLTTGITGLIPIRPFNLKWINFSYSRQFIQPPILQEICSLLYSLPHCNFQTFE